MRLSWKALQSWLAGPRPSPARDRQRTRPRLEILEDRLVPSATPTVDLTTAGASGIINGAIFRQANFQPAGSGVINAFVRIQAHSSTVEQGYNTDARPLQFDEQSSPVFTRSLQLGNVPVAMVNNAAYREFVLDINQSAKQPLLSLDALRIYDGSAPNLLGYHANTAQLAGLSPLYDMDAGGSHWVELNGNLAQGTGKGDMVLYVPNSDFAGKASNSYVYLYSEFGANAPANAGFEQWAVGTSAITAPVSLPVASLSGSVLTNDTGLAGVTVTLTGMTLTGQTVTLVTTTDVNGHYSFSVAPGSYRLDQTVPTNYVEIAANAGTVNGVTDGAVWSGAIAGVTVAAGDNGVQYNFVDALMAGGLPS